MNGHIKLFSNTFLYGSGYSCSGSMLDCEERRELDSLEDFEYEFREILSDLLEYELKEIEQKMKEDPEFDISDYYHNVLGKDYLFEFSFYKFDENENYDLNNPTFECHIWESEFLINELGGEQVYNYSPRYLIW